MGVNAAEIEAAQSEMELKVSALYANALLLQRGAGRSRRLSSFKWLKFAPKKQRRPLQRQRLALTPKLQRLVQTLRCMAVFDVSVGTRSVC